MVGPSLHRTVNCPICNSPENYSRYEFSWGKIHQCRDCTGAFVDGCDVEEENTETFSNGHGDVGGGRHRQWSAERLGALQKFMVSGTLLEFGPGTGEFLHTAAAAGFQAAGVDRFPHLRTENKREGVSVVQADARTYRSANPFDVVAGIHVLEHFVNPYEFLSSVRENLKSSGLFLVEVPNYASLSRVVIGRRWNCFASYHALQFTPRSLSALLEKAGFKVMQLESVGCSTTQLLGLGIPFLGRRLGMTLDYNWEDGAFRELATSVERRFGWGSNLRVVAQKI